MYVHIQFYTFTRPNHVKYRVNVNLPRIKASQPTENESLLNATETFCSPRYIGVERNPSNTNSCFVSLEAKQVVAAWRCAGLALEIQGL